MRIFIYEWLEKHRLKNQNKIDCLEERLNRSISKAKELLDRHLYNSDSNISPISEHVTSHVYKMIYKIVQLYLVQ